MNRKNWNREELIVAFSLYCITPFGKIHTNNPDIIKLAKLLGRSPSAVSWKLANFSSLDPSLKERGIKGAGHGSKLEHQIWEEFYTDWEKLVQESEKIMMEMDKTSNEYSLEDRQLFETTETTGIQKIRRHQNFFRKSVLSAYNYKCCITGINVPSLLMASHIVPWSKNENNRINPMNGLCLNALHDKAFDRGLITISSNYKVVLSGELLEGKQNKGVKENFIFYKNKEIVLPKRFLPNPEFLEYHNKNIFLGV